MVENVEELGAELSAEPLREFERLAHGHIQVVERCVAPEPATRITVAAVWRGRQQPISQHVATEVGEGSQRECLLTAGELALVHSNAGRIRLPCEEWNSLRGGKSVDRSKGARVP